jgi:hypothetical protein
LQALKEANAATAADRDTAVLDMEIASEVSTRGVQLLLLSRL